MYLYIHYQKVKQMGFKKTIVFGPGSIFNNYHQAEAHGTTISHWCPSCLKYRSVYMDKESLLCCETCKNTSLQPEIRITTEKESG